MADKSNAKDSTTQNASDPFNILSQLQNAGFGNMMGMNTAWMETLTDMSAEVASFVAERIKEDTETQHEIMQCKTATDLQHVQAQFIQKAMDQYHEETGKLVEMGTKAFTPKSDADKG